MTESQDVKKCGGGGSDAKQPTTAREVGCASLRLFSQPESRAEGLKTATLSLSFKETAQVMLLSDFLNTFKAGDIKIKDCLGRSHRKSPATNLEKCPP